MKINWKVRIKSKKFWLTVIPAALLLAQTVAVPFGYNFDIAKIGTDLTAVINALFALLAILGIVIDPTTSGVADSDTAMTNEIKSKVQVQNDLLTAQNKVLLEQLADVGSMANIATGTLDASQIKTEKEGK